MKQRLQRACRNALRPLAGWVRKLLTPPPQPIEFSWHTIKQGPAAGTEALLPRGSELAEAITSGRYESQIIAIVAALVEPQHHCLDIGGHYGYYTLALARLASRGQVRTFEPVPQLAERIRQAAERSRLVNVSVQSVAMAGQEGEMVLQFAAAGGDDSMAYLEAYGGVDTPAAHEHYQRFSRLVVPTVTLDSLLSEPDLPHFIKIDAEGAEAPILQAGRQLLARAKPRLLIELHGIHEALACAELLDAIGYRAILLTDQKITLPILWAPRDDEQALRTVRDVLGHDPIVLFDRGCQAGRT
jgi:FkbM family methyltransferase